jgi:hypothetical protein
VQTASGRIGWQAAPFTATRRTSDSASRSSSTRAFHDNARARDRDAGRDLDTLVADDSVTVRLTYGQVFDHGCETIAKIAALLQRRGWAGPFVRCPHCH